MTSSGDISPDDVMTWKLFFLSGSGMDIEDKMEPFGRGLTTLVEYFRMDYTILSKSPSA